MILHGDSLELLKTLDADSVDAVVTDPPYGLSFMGKKWDYDVPSADLWREVHRVLKPGAHLLSFGGTRTYHRLALAIEDAGFEIRDQIQWIYGSGFPKSLDISKAIDKAAGASREVVGHQSYKSNLNIQGGNLKGAECLADNYVPTPITAPATPDAKRWQGFGTALKPANEPIVLARKPLSERTVALNVLRWGTGALNIDGSRIATDDNLNGGTYSEGAKNGEVYGGGLCRPANRPFVQPQGRWPANVLFGCECDAEKSQDSALLEIYGDHHLPRCAVRMLDEQSGPCKTGGRTIKTDCGDAFFKVNVDTVLAPDVGSGASRFFYVAKASKRERNAGLEGMPEKDAPGSKRSTPAEGRTSALGAPRANHHPTVKPLKLMEYLCTLITPPGGVVLDPFMGSGSTGVAAKRLGFEFVGIERELDYVNIARRRIEHAGAAE